MWLAYVSLALVSRNYALSETKYLQFSQERMVIMYFNSTEQQVYVKVTHYYF